MYISEAVKFIISAYDIYTIDDVLNMTPDEISILQQAFSLREEREVAKLHLASWLNRQVEFKNKKGTKYLYKTFDEFYTVGNKENSSSNKHKTRKVDEALSAKRSKEEVMQIARNLQEYKNKQTF